MGERTADKPRKTARAVKAKDIFWGGMDWKTFFLRRYRIPQRRRSKTNPKAKVKE